MSSNPSPPELDAMIAAREVVVRVQELGKCYQIYDKPQHRLWQGVLRGRRQLYREFWALRDVSFDLHRGETMGIIGRNGSGKSTLLQLVCGTMTPTRGSVQCFGRVAALLELGAGFNPEFTGRENVDLSAALLGLSAAETRERLNDIIAFADIGEFIDQPVKHYSSGMLVRLAFAVQASIDPEILIVDEALAVGDLAFTLKCMRRLDELKKRGCSILFVSHEVGVVQKLCDRALYLDRGEMRSLGEAAKVCSLYVSAINTTVARGEATGEAGTSGNAPDEPGSWPDEATIAAFQATLTGVRTGSRDLEVRFARLTLPAGRTAAMFDDTLVLDVYLEAKAEVDAPCVSAYLVDRSGQLVVGTNTFYEGLEPGPLQAGDRLHVRFGFLNRLRDGEYGVTVIASSFLGQTQTSYLDYIEPALAFRALASIGRERWALYNAPVDTQMSLNGRNIAPGAER
jgi:lipopolysaccharide transport system ATP-binding protein